MSVNYFSTKVRVYLTFFLLLTIHNGNVYTSLNITFLFAYKPGIEINTVSVERTCPEALIQSCIYQCEVIFWCLCFLQLLNSRLCSKQELWLKNLAHLISQFPLMMHNEPYQESTWYKCSQKDKVEKPPRQNVVVAVFCVNYIYTKDYCKFLKSLSLSCLKNHERTWLSEGVDHSTYYKPAIPHNEN